MKIELDEIEIKAAIINYVGSQGITIDPDKTKVDLKAGRGDNGMTAYVMIGLNGDVEVKVEAKENVENLPEPKDTKKLKFGSDG